jgi:phage N-6-adenine-methyltransferase
VPRTLLASAYVMCYVSRVKRWIHTYRDAQRIEGAWFSLHMNQEILEQLVQQAITPWSSRADWRRTASGHPGSILASDAGEPMLPEHTGHKRLAGRPRLHAHNAAKQRAYRVRQAAWRKRCGPKVYHQSNTVEWETPQAFFDALHTEFGFTLDVAAQPHNAKCERYCMPQDDGLRQPWEGVCWMNPPYGKDLDIWVAKAYTSAQAGATVVCLLSARTDTRWWHMFVTQASEVHFVQGRLTFGGATNRAPFPKVVVGFRPPTARACPYHPTVLGSGYAEISMVVMTTIVVPSLTNTQVMLLAFPTSECGLCSCGFLVYPA